MVSEVLTVSTTSLQTHVQLTSLNFRYCGAFPAIKGAIQRVKKEKERVEHKNDDKKSSKSSSKSDLVSKVKSDVRVSTGTSTSSFTLQRRLSTATPVKYDMYVVFKLKRFLLSLHSLSSSDILTCLIRHSVSNLLTSISGT